MSGFRSLITQMKGHDTYVLLGATAIKVKIARVVDDTVVLKLGTTLGGVKELTVHIDTIQIVSG